MRNVGGNEILQRGMRENAFQNDERLFRFVLFRRARFACRSTRCFVSIYKLIYIYLHGGLDE